MTYCPHCDDERDFQWDVDPNATERMTLACSDCGSSHEALADMLSAKTTPTP